MLKKVFAFIFWCVAFSHATSFAQNILEPEDLKAAKTFYSLQDALLQPDSVIKLSLKGKKLKVFPAEVFTFPNLQSLDLSRNNISEIPDKVSSLKNLQELNLSNNRLTQINPQTGSLKNLVKLSLNKNEITSIPPEIGNIVNLEVLEMWDNELDTVPDELRGLIHLKTFELRGILFSDDEQKRIHDLLPAAAIYFSPSCACKQ